MTEKTEKGPIFRYWAHENLWLSPFDLPWSHALLEAAEKVAKGYWHELKIGHIEDGTLKIDLIIVKAGTCFS